MASMASIKTNQLMHGGCSYTVVWRGGGSRTGQWGRETFDDETAANRFRDLVNGHGQQWPPGRVKGEGFVESSEPECPADELFPAYARKYVELLMDISGHTRTNYERFIENHMTPWFRDLAVSDRANKITRDHISQWINGLKEGRPGPHHEPGTNGPGARAWRAGERVGRRPRRGDFTVDRVRRLVGAERSRGRRRVSPACTAGDRPGRGRTG